MKYILLFISVGLFVVSLFFVEWVNLDATDDVKKISGLILSSIFHLQYKVLDVEGKLKGKES